MSEILPCPACGSVVDGDECPYPDSKGWHCISCVDGDCTFVAFGPTPDDAVRQWNRRAALSRPQAKVPKVVEVRPVVVKDEPDAHQVWLHVGCQHFQVGLHHETKDEAEWFAQMLRTALAALCTNNQEIAR